MVTKKNPESSSKVITIHHANGYHENSKKPPQTANPNPKYKPPIGHKK